MPELFPIVTVNGEVFRAEAGHDSLDGYIGADGYSGGGAWCTGCDGGSNGGDGDGFLTNRGGHGTGEDLSVYKLVNWVLSPGIGGRNCYDEYNRKDNGGGGGGVLVNGEGPLHHWSKGEGYGGGGSFCADNGVDGVILVEIGNRE